MHDNKPEVKAKHKKRRKERIYEQMMTFIRSQERKQAACESGMMAPDGVAAATSGAGCSFCGLLTHKRRTSKLCLMSTNPSSQYYNATHPATSSVGASRQTTVANASEAVTPLQSIDSSERESSEPASP